MSEYNLVSATLRQELSYLSQFGFEFAHEKVTQSDSLGEELSICYQNESTKISLVFDYSPIGRSNYARFTVFIHHPNGDYVSIIGHLQKLDRYDITSLFTNRNPTISTEEYTRKFAQTLRPLLETTFLTYLTGETLPPPFDWGPYK